MSGQKLFYYEKTLDHGRSLQLTSRCVCVLCGLCERTDKWTWFHAKDARFCLLVSAFSDHGWKECIYIMWTKPHKTEEQINVSVVLSSSESSNRFSFNKRELYREEEELVLFK
jgi:hypothetical protein